MNRTLISNVANLTNLLQKNSSAANTWTNLTGNSAVLNISDYEVLSENISTSDSWENSSYSNETDYDYYNENLCLENGTGSMEDWGREVVSLLLALLILLSNSFVVVAMLRLWSREGRPLGSRATASFLVLNLAVSDALVGVFQIFQWFHITVCSFNKQMVGTSFTCLLPFALVQFADSASAITVVVIAVDRVLSVTHAVRYRNALTPRLTLEAIVVIWGIALFIALTIYIIPGAYQMRQYETGMQCEIDAKYDMILFWGTVVLLFATLISCYWTIHRVTLHMLRRGSDVSTRNLVGTKAARMLLTVIAWDTCAYFPVFVVTMLNLAGVTVSEILYLIVESMTLLTFLADPYIYAYGNPHSKKAISDLVRCMRGKAPLDIDAMGNRESLAETSTYKIRRMMTSFTASSTMSDVDGNSPLSRRNSLRLE